MQIFVLYVEQTSSAHQTSNICCLHNTFSCVATLSELNSSQKFGILQIVLSGGSIWQWSLVSVTETLLSNKEHRVLFAGCHTTGDHFFTCIFLSACSLKTLSSPDLFGVSQGSCAQSFPLRLSPLSFPRFSCAMDNWRAQDVPLTWAPTCI